MIKKVPAHEYYVPGEDDVAATEVTRRAIAKLEDGKRLSTVEKLALFKARHARQAWSGIDCHGGYPAEAVIFANGTVVACNRPLTEHDGLEVTTLDEFVRDLAENGFQWFEEGDSAHDDPPKEDDRKGTRKGWP